MARAELRHPRGPRFGSFWSLGRGRVLLGGQEAARLWKRGCVSHPLRLPPGLPGRRRSSRAVWWGADFAGKGCYAAVGVRVPRGTAPASHGHRRHVSHVQAARVRVPRGPRLPASRRGTACACIPRGPRARVPPREQLRAPVPAPFPPGERLQVTGGRGGVQLGSRAWLLLTNRETPSPEAVGSAQHLYTRVENRVRVGGRASKYRPGYLGCSHACSEDSFGAGCKEIITEYTLSLSARNASSPRRKTSHSKLLLVPFFIFFFSVMLPLSGISSRALLSLRAPKGLPEGQDGTGDLTMLFVTPQSQLLCTVGRGW